MFLQFFFMYSFLFLRDYLRPKIEGKKKQYIKKQIYQVCCVLCSWANQWPTGSSLDYLKDKYWWTEQTKITETPKWGWRAFRGTPINVLKGINLWCLSWMLQDSKSLLSDYGLLTLLQFYLQICRIENVVRKQMLDNGCEQMDMGGELDKPWCPPQAPVSPGLGQDLEDSLMSSGGHRQTYLNTKPHLCLPPPCCTETLTSSSRQPVGSSPHTS